MDDVDQKLVRALYNEWVQEKEKLEEQKAIIADIIDRVVEKVQKKKADITAVFENRYKQEITGKDTLSGRVFVNEEIFGTINSIDEDGDE